jgi:hypothetical protein
MQRIRPHFNSTKLCDLTAARPLKNEGRWERDQYAAAARTRVMSGETEYYGKYGLMSRHKTLFLNLFFLYVSIALIPQTMQGKFCIESKVEQQSSGNQEYVVLTEMYVFLDIVIRITS